MLEVISCEQGTDEWRFARLGIPTASMFSTVMAKGQGDGESKTRRTYMLKLIGERLTGEPSESYTNAHMERGKIMEEEARSAYAFQTGHEPVLVGFVRNGGHGASPDSMIDSDGLLEVKTKLPHLQLEVLLANEMPPEHKAQVQGQIWTCERDWCDFVSYWPRLPMFVKRIYRDDEYIKLMSAAIDVFLIELDNIQAKLKPTEA